MKITFKKLAALSVATCLSTTAHAEIQWNGFASIVAGQTTSSGDTLNGYDDSISLEQGSFFALQASNDLGDGLSVTAQILARGENDWDPEFEWAYLSYAINDQLNIKVGRQRAPFYMFSDYLDVSYAYPWISPPKGVYNVPFSKLDAISATYTSTLGEFDVSTQLIYGNYDGDVTTDDGTFNVETNNLGGFSVTVTRDWLTLRGAYFVASDTNVMHPVLAGTAASWSSAGYHDVASQLLVAEDEAVFAELGLQIDYNDYIVIAEYASLEIKNSYRAKEASYYVTLGKRFDDVLVHVTYGKDDDESRVITNDVASGNLQIDALKAGTDAFMRTQEDDSSYVTLGLRWDFHSSAALKFEYTDYSNDINAASDANLFRMAFVTVF
ncbi:MAG: hypothetical protein HRU23_17245 [Gammaproteobacteria bacterium]|nr:hypothetical protein [Gammaproteobacteria bacterium]